MRALSTAASIFLILTLVACLPGTNQQQSASIEDMNETLSQALQNPKQFQTKLKESCTHYKSLLLDVAETINLGSRIWNAGGPLLTIRIYEGMTYKTLYIIGNDCTELSHAFQAGLARAQKEKVTNEKGRILRGTLDLIMGGAPSKPPGA